MLCHYVLNFSEIKAPAPEATVYISEKENGGDSGMVDSQSLALGEGHIPEAIEVEAVGSFPTGGPLSRIHFAQR